MGAHQAADRFFRSTVISGNVYQQDVAGSAAVNTTVNSYALGGLFATIQFVPTTTQTASSTVPAAPSTATNKGWRDVTAEDAANQITWDAVNWTVRLRMLSSQAQSCLTTVIVYRQNGSGTTEIGRGTATTSLTTTIATVTVTVAASAALVFAAGDKIQVEVYTTTLLAGIATPPTTATTITCRIGESDANSGAKISPGTYATQVVRAVSTAISIAGAAARQISGARSFTTALSLAIVVQRHVTPTAKVAGLSLVGTVQKRVAPTAKTAALSLGTSVQKLVPLSKSAALSLAGSFSRQIAANRVFTTSVALGTAFARSVNSARSFSAALSLSVTGAAQIPFSVLNRMAAGGTTVVKKLIAIFDD